MDYQSRSRELVDVRRVLKNLESDDITAVKQGIDAAAGFVGNEEICSALTPLLRHEDGDIRSRTAMALGHVLHHDSIRHLEIALSDRVPRVRSTAVDALARLRSSRSAPMIAPLLRDHSPEVRYSACEALGTLRYVHAAPHIMALLSDPEDIVRLGAAESLGYLRIPATAPVLVKALNDKFHLVRAYAAESLGLIGNPEVKGALKKRLTVETASRARLGIYTALFRLGEEDELRIIIGFLRDQNPLSRRAAAATLVDLGDQSASGSVLVALKRALQKERQRQTREALEKAVKTLSERSSL